MSFQKKLALVFFVIFAVFALGTLLLEGHKFFLLIVLFAFGSVLVYYLICCSSSYFNNFIRQLRDFYKTLDKMLENEDDSIKIPQFNKDEFIEIKNRIVEDFHKIKENELRLTQEREKLLMHIQASAEGICFFNPNRTVAFYNGLFLQYFNIISLASINIEREMLNDKVFIPVVDFLDKRNNEDYFEIIISKQGNEFSLRVNAFVDKSFEIILVDITKQEKTKRLKREITGNISHELRTPVTSIYGFLEIVLNNGLDEGKKREYLERAFSKTQTLSELISDIGLLTKIDERANDLRFNNVNISELLKKVKADTAAALARKNIKFNEDIPKDLFIAGNESLLYSIFCNLTNNVISHAGENISINISVYEIRGEMAYFLFSDTGRGVEKHIHLDRLFERFYRVNEGRTRNTGGSGLGLSIVKNAVLFHKGTITVSNGSGNGLEFLFSLPVCAPPAV